MSDAPPLDFVGPPEPPPTGTTCRRAGPFGVFPDMTVSSARYDGGAVPLLMIQRLCAGDRGRSARRISNLLTYGLEFEDEGLILAQAT
jgi:hypothetical protein